MSGRRLPDHVRDRAGLLAVSAGALLWGTTGPLAVAGLAGIVLHEMLSGRAVVGALLMLAAVGSLYARRPLRVPPPP